MKPQISIIIVNFNTAEFLDRCLTSILGEIGVKFEVIVSDNASQDHSVEMVREGHPWVRILSNSKNFGFAKANNLGMRYASSDLIFFLNPDTEVHRGCLKGILEYMAAHPEVGLAGTTVVYPDLTPQSSVEYGYPGHRYAARDLKGLPGEIAWLLGASLVIRRPVVDMVGGFDERYFLYGEDIDLGLMVRKAGWFLGFIPTATITHWEGQSERESIPIEVLKKKFEAEFIFYHKHYSAETIRKIKRANYLQSLWRIFTLNLIIPFLHDKSKARVKLARYQLAREVYE